MNLAGPRASVSPTMHGLFFEDINYGADGGLYAELVQNRSFEHKESLYAWSTTARVAQGEVKIEAATPLNAKNTHFVRLNVTKAGRGFGVSNTGFGGIAVKQGEPYRFSLYARAKAGYKGALQVQLEAANGRVLGQTRLTGLTTQWKKFERVIQVSNSAQDARLTVLATANGQVDLDMVSLFPVHTYNDRRNGLRADLVQQLKSMHPGFMRFPGGCIVEGDVLSNAYRWKDTIGDVATRPQNYNRWYTWQAPQYYQTYGLGFYEYFQLCEDIGAEPVPVINVGMACQYQSGQTVPLEKLAPWVQDALDLVEFANGPVTSTWGTKRAAMGHPKPFNMKFIGVGNEQWGEGYFERYAVFSKALKAKYPNISLVSTSGPGVDDQWWNLAWNKFKAGTPAQVVDEHYYRPPAWFLQQHTRYDHYARTGPKVFAGEYASHTDGKRNNLEAALSEAAFMTGLLRNADVVSMASYAPLFAKVGSTQWTPDLIWFDNSRVYGSPSYYVQEMYGQNRPDVTMPVHIDLAPQAAPTYPGMIGVGTWNTQAEFKDIKVTKGNQTLYASDFSRGLQNWKTSRGQWSAKDGVLCQSASETDVRAYIGDPTWTDYTLSLKARKTGGSEGFLVMFQSPSTGSTLWWNVGGWNNTAHGLEVPGTSNPQVKGHIETGRWYDVRVELQGATIKCYLDGQLIQQVERAQTAPLYAVAGSDNKTGEIILDVVNVSDQPMACNVALEGVARVAGNAKLTVLTSKNIKDENSFERPKQVTPIQSTLTVPASKFAHTFPAHSFSILRLKSR